MDESDEDRNKQSLRETTLESMESVRCMVRLTYAWLIELKVESNCEN